MSLLLRPALRGPESAAPYDSLSPAAEPAPGARASSSRRCLMASASSNLNSSISCVPRSIRASLARSGSLTAACTAWVYRIPAHVWEHLLTSVSALTRRARACAPPTLDQRVW